MAEVIPSKDEIIHAESVAIAGDAAETERIRLAGWGKSWNIT